MQFGFIFLVPLMFGFVTGDSWQVTLCNIGLVNSLDVLHCTELQDSFNFEEGNNINIELNDTSKIIKISASGGNSPNELYCDAGKWFNAFNSTTSNFNCETVPTGNTYENNTASNVGLGEDIFKQKTGVDLEFKGISVSGDLSISSNASDITISYIDPVSGSGNATVLDNLGDVVLTSPSNFSILFYNAGVWLDQIFKINSFDISCTGTDKVSRVAIDNQTGLQTVTCSTDETGGATREEMVGVWHIDRTWTNIGTTFVNVYATGNGDLVRIDTNEKTTVTLMIDWTKVGAGTQSCQIVSTTNPSIILVRYGNLISGINTNATQDIPSNAENRLDTFKPQCLSSTSTDDPVWLSGQVLLQ